MKLKRTKNIHYYCIQCDKPIDVNDVIRHLRNGHTVKAIETTIIERVK